MSVWWSNRAFIEHLQNEILWLQDRLEEERARVVATVVEERKVRAEMVAEFKALVDAANDKTEQERLRAELAIDAERSLRSEIQAVTSPTPLSGANPLARPALTVQERRTMEIVKSMTESDEFMGAGETGDGRESLE